MAIPYYNDNYNCVTIYRLTDGLVNVYFIVGQVFTDTGAQLVLIILLVI